jgi:predicted porin
LLENDFSATLGIFVNEKNLTLSLNGASPGDQIDFDEYWALGNSKSRGAGEFRWDFGEKWSVAGQYFASNDSASAVLEEDVIWGDLTFGAGSNVSAGIEADVARLLMGRSVSAGANHDFELGIGLHWLRLGAFLEGEAFINDEPTGLTKETASASAPLPNVGASYRYAFTPRWLLHARVDWFSADIGEYSGSLWNAAAGAEYQLSKNFGLSLAYQFFRIDVDVDSGNWKGAVEVSFEGPFVSVTATW